jgi:hypothetical protein
MSTEKSVAQTLHDVGGVRTPGQVRQQLKQVMFRHLQKMLRANFRKSPETCLHNRKEPLAGTNEKVGICRHTGAPRGKVCDARVFGCINMAAACRWWEPLHTKSDIKGDFRDLMTSGNRGRIAAAFPDIAALMWVLDGNDDVGDELRLVEEQADQEIPESESPEPPEMDHE